MDEEIERLVVSVRADTAAFARDVDEMRKTLDGPLAAGAEQAGRAIEAGLLRAVRTGKFGFEDLRRIALSVLAEIAEAAVRAGIGSILKTGRPDRDDDDSGGHGGLLSGIVGLIGGLAGRATGGPVGPGTAYVVGERGPELFVPTSSGRVETGVIAARGGGLSPAIARDRPVSATLAEIMHSREGWGRPTSAEAAASGAGWQRASVQAAPASGAGWQRASVHAAPASSAGWQRAPDRLAPGSGAGWQRPDAAMPVASAVPAPPPPVIQTREVRVAITVNARGGGDAPAALARSSRQVARAVKSALGSID